MQTRERSPNYPVRSLEEAVAMAAVIYGKQKRSAVAQEILARDLGHEGLTGPSRGKLASLRHYGLLEPSGGNLRLSDRAFTILHSPDASERSKAINEAALEPGLFAELKAEKPDASDEALAYYLRRDRKFTDDGAARAVQVYKATMAFAEANKSGYTPDERRGATDVKTLENPPKPPPSGYQIPAEQASKEKQAVSYTWPLPNGTDVQITFAQRPDLESVEAVIDYLNVVKPKVTTRPATSPEPNKTDEQEAEGAKP